MRKNLLALSIAAMVGGLSGVANAQALNTGGTLDLVSFNPNDLANTVGVPGVNGGQPVVGPLRAGFGSAIGLAPTTTGVGHALVVPYFTSQGANHSLLNIVNTDEQNGKAVKLRYRGALNSDDLFDITIYLSPGDMWTADVSVDADGFSRLETSDTSCTLPSIRDIKEANNGRFLVHRVLNADKEQTREGYIEILNTADIPPGTALFNAIKHVNGEAPCTQAVMDLQSNPLTTAGANTPAVRGYSWPTGGLFANWAIVDVTSTASFSGEAVALRAAATNFIDDNGSGRIVWAPQTSDIVTLARAKNLTADPLFRDDSVDVANRVIPVASVKASSYDFPDLSTPYTIGAADPAAQARDLARAFSASRITNEYLTNPSIGFQTDWVFSMPTRRYAVAVDYAGKRLVFNPLVNEHFTNVNVTLEGGTTACVDAGSVRGYDREENRVSFVISPNPIHRFCGETSVAAFNKKATDATLLGAKIARGNFTNTKYVDGWFTISTPGIEVPAGSGNFRGLPIIGFAAAKANGNIGGTWMHRYER